MTQTAEILQDSGETEYYTDPVLVQAARQVMGSIDLDPASSVEANEIIKAAIIYTKNDDTLNNEWLGNIWMNHPFGRINNPLFIEKILKEYTEGRIQQACCITYASTSERWFKHLYDYPICFLVPRTNYYKPDGTKKSGVQKGSAITYFGNNVEIFHTVFSQYGEVMIRYKP